MKIKLYVFPLLLFFFFGCAEEINGPLENNRVAPQQVSNILVDNLPGRVLITYTLPKDQDLLYIKAKYQLESGVYREVKASYYTDSITLDGFRDAKKYEVALYSVNRSEVESEPVIIDVYPLENPIWRIFETLKISGDFSGVNIQADNPEEYPGTIELTIQDSINNWVPLGNIHSSAKKINRTERGLDTVFYNVGAVVRDRFLNYTDTLFAEIKPLYEQLLDKSKFSMFKLPGDASISNEAYLNVNRLWDGDNNYTQPWRLYTDNSPEPQWVTFNMGQTARLSRIKIWNYGIDPTPGARWFFYQGHMRFFQIWGTMEPNPDGSWDNWFLLGDFEVIKPSGLPMGTESNEDFEAGVAGFDFNFDLGPQVRYIRIKNLLNWEGSYFFEIKEISIYGDPR